MTVGKLTHADRSVCADVAKLLKQLRDDPKEHNVSLADAERIVRDKNVVLIVAKDKGHIVGMGTLYMITKFGKRTGHVEDVVVDGSYRGRGLGKKIMRVIIAAAKKGKLSSVSLTSRPEREAANRLYQKVGFEHKETNVYRLKL